MSRLNAIQRAILELNGGAYHNLFDEYAHKKFRFDNIHSLGVQSATNKSTIGIPDTYVVNEDGTYTLLMYGTVQGSSYTKIKDDIESCLKEYKQEIERGEVKKIIVGYTSTNINPRQLEELNDLNPDLTIDFIGLSTLSHDLLVHYPHIALDHLNISIDSEQIFTAEEFIERNDNNKMNTPLSVRFISREDEQEKLYERIGESKFTLVTGQSGIGKTKLVLEVCKQYEENGYKVLCIKNNGLGIHDDLRYHLDNPGEYLLFIDDINQTSSLEYILEFVTTPPKGVSIKVVATVRDYAKQQTEKKTTRIFSIF